MRLKYEKEKPLNKTVCWDKLVAWWVLKRIKTVIIARDKTVCCFKVIQLRSPEENTDIMQVYIVGFLTVLQFEASLFTLFRFEQAKSLILVHGQNKICKDRCLKADHCSCPNNNNNNVSLQMGERSIKTAKHGVFSAPKWAISIDRLVTVIGVACQSLWCWK